MARAEQQSIMTDARGPGVARLAGMFERLAEEQRGGFAAYIVAGDPDLAATERLMQALPGAGADLIELGFPFSDPLAEGSAIQEGHKRALRGGTRLPEIFNLVRRWRQLNAVTPLLLMGYLNPVLQYGPAKFVSEAADCGIDGFIIVDLPHESALLLQGPSAKRGLATVLIVAPSTSKERTEEIARETSGFLYCAATSGTTGSQRIDIERTRKRVERLRAVSNKPVAVGFGIQTPEDVLAVQQFADLAVVGSVLVRGIGDAGKDEAVDAAVRLTQGLSATASSPVISNA